MKQLGGFYNAKKGCTRSHKFGSVLNVLSGSMAFVSTSGNRYVAPWG